MRRSDEAARPIDWRAWLSLAWMVGFGLLYCAMIVREKAPGLVARWSRGGTAANLAIGRDLLD